MSEKLKKAFSEMRRHWEARRRKVAPHLSPTWDALKSGFNDLRHLDQDKLREVRDALVKLAVVLTAEEAVAHHPA